VKVKVTLKDPDTMHDAVDFAVQRLERPEGVDQGEWENICEERAEKAKAAITERWMPYGEYLVVEFDTEAMTATVRLGSDLH
jgi:hypothetical protein